jgi:putative ABC transport system substrate-binding protein
MRRRQFIAGLGSAAAWPLAARAQQPVIPVIGFIGAGPPDELKEIRGFHRGLLEAGYVEGRNLAIEYRWANSRMERMPELAADLVRRGVAAIAVMSTAGALALKAATKTIPIVFWIGSDPVEIGLVASLSRPSGNITGIYNLQGAVAAKRLEVTHELVPTATTIGFLVNRDNAVYAQIELREVQAAARTLGLNLLILDARDKGEFERVFTTIDLRRPGALVIGGDSLFLDEGAQLAAMTTQHAVPTLFPDHRATVAGGLMSYGTDFPDGHRQAGAYVARILKGQNPADLPVQQVTKMQLTINMKTAKALSLTIPLTLLGRADEVIE